MCGSLLLPPRQRPLFSQRGDEQQVIDALTIGWPKTSRLVRVVTHTVMVINLNPLNVVEGSMVRLKLIRLRLQVKTWQNDGNSM